jgi:hypothetical protein
VTPPDSRASSEIGRLQGLPIGSNNVPPARISDQLRAGTVDIDVDISDCTEDEREAATTALMNMKGPDSPRAGDTAETLYYA